MMSARRVAALMAAAALSGAIAIMMQGQAQRIPYDVHEVALGDASLTCDGLSNAGEAYADDSEAGAVSDERDLAGDAVAWVRIPGTTIDYPVMQANASSPDFYLTHDAYGRDSAWGAPYIDAECAAGLRSPLVIVYGHHMSDGTMFAPLARYSDATFASARRCIEIADSVRARHLEVFAVDVVDASEEGKQTSFDNFDELRAYINLQLDGCEVVLERPAGLNQVWAFVTCSYQTDDSRMVVYAREIGCG